MNERHYRIGIDVGGTFTDFVLIDEDGGQPISFKVPSTPDEPSQAVIEGLSHITAELAPAASISTIVHGTTLGLNAIVQRRGAKVGLVVTRGFRDVLQLTQRLPEEFNLRQPHLQSLVERADILETSARFDAQGRPLAATGDSELTELAEELSQREVGAVAVSLLHGYAAPEAEETLARRLQEALRADGSEAPVSSAASIWPQIREYERTSLATLNAYIHPLMREYLASLQRNITELGITAPLFVTTSAGGCVSVEAAAARPVETILSGPASGVVAAGLLASAASGTDESYRGLISLDMGGTSTDMSVIVDGEPSYATRTEVGGIPLITPVVDVNAIGTGGGSIVRVDNHGMLQVGPESAGAEPGPIAFGHGGTELTLTDIYLLAGIISPVAFEKRFGALNMEGARKAAKQIASDLGYSGADPLAFALSAALEISTVLSTSELQKVLARNGYAAEEFAIAPFGGAGPVAGALLADEVGAGMVLVPLQAGTFCALGAAWSDIRREFLRGVGRPLQEASGQVCELVTQLSSKATGWAREQNGLDPQATVTCRTGFTARYRGQAFTLEVELDAAELPVSATELTERFHSVHEREFGYRDISSPIEVTAVRALVTVPVPGVPQLGAASGSMHLAQKQGREVLLGNRWEDVPTLNLPALAENGKITGPAIIDLPDTTVFIPPHWHGELTDTGAAIALTRPRVEASNSPALTEGAGRTA